MADDAVATGAFGPGVFSPDPALAAMDEHRRLLESDDYYRSSRPSDRSSPTSAGARLLRAAGLTLGLIAIAFVCLQILDHPPSSVSVAIGATTLEHCAWQLLAPHVSLLSVPPIGFSEFIARQHRLADALADAGVDAFVAEPSASSTYYFNVSAAFDLSERPFLLLLSDKADFSYLVPSFEAGRIAGLDMAYESKTVIPWPETESPYEVLARESGFRRVMVDEHVRYMIAAGLEKAGIEVVPMSERVQKLRAVKHESEIAILKAINRFTLELVRAIRPCLQLGVTQEAALEAAEALFTHAGVGKGFWALVLFGSQAAFPHGGKHGKTLQDGEFVLIDIGSELHGYGSDVTRTILPPGITVSDDLMQMWDLVKASQSAAFDLMRANQSCSDVDAASRKVIKDAGFGEFYTHRLGHGLGLETHEHPYLNGANGEKLSIGEVASNEPGIYVTTEQARKIGREIGFGIRLEDPVLVTENGGEALTGYRAESPYDP